MQLKTPIGKDRDDEHLRLVVVSCSPRPTQGSSQPPAMPAPVGPRLAFAFAASLTCTVKRVNIYSLKNHLKGCRKRKTGTANYCGGCGGELWMGEGSHSKD